MKIETEPKVLSLWAQEVNRALSRLNEEYFKGMTLSEGVGYVLTMEGKRVRPLICLLSSAILSEQMEISVLPLKTAMALEVFHNFTLVHDDWMDNATLRRKQRTLHTLTSPEYAVLVGDALYALAQKLIAEDPNNRLPLRSADYFASVGIKVCEGQSLELSSLKKEIGLQEYLKILELKTAELIAASFVLGALAAGKTEETERLYELGKNIGIYFQLQDDIMDFFPPKKFGKIIGGDIMENKKTILWFVSYEKASQEDKEKLKNLFDLPATEKLNLAGELFRKYNAAENAWEFTRQYEEKILQLIKEIQADYPNELLLPFFLYLKNRNR